jgi:hypothetical protein
MNTRASICYNLRWGARTISASEEASTLRPLGLQLQGYLKFHKVPPRIMPCSAPYRSLLRDRAQGTSRRLPPGPTGHRSREDRRNPVKYPRAPRTARSPRRVDLQQPRSNHDPAHLRTLTGSLRGKPVPYHSRSTHTRVTQNNMHTPQFCILMIPCGETTA